MDEQQPQSETTEIPEAPRAPSRWEGMGTRLVSGVICAAVFLVILYKGGWLFTWLILMAALMMMREWNGLTDREGPLWRFAGLFYVTIPCASLIWLRDVRSDYDPLAGLHLVLYLMLAVWSTDIGAYIAGRQIGGPKLAPVISPNKTWAGLGGGVVAAMITGGLCHLFSPYPLTLWASIALAGVLAAMSQGGDLFESWLKRRADVKDSGTLIPGHGGLLDRVDGLIPTTPLFALAVYASGIVG